MKPRLALDAPPSAYPALDAANSAPERVVGRPFQPGQSGNPSGRPKALAVVVEAARCMSVEALETLAGIMRDEDAPAAARIAAASAILDRGWGKPTIGEPDALGGQQISLQVITGVVREIDGGC